MRLDFYISPNVQKEFAGAVEVLLRNVDRATKAGTEQACKDVLEMSLAQVPRDTGTLASTGFYTVQKRGAVKGYTYEGTVGYAGMAGAGYTRNAINPKNGKAASTYAAKVHEDLKAYHEVGKAKYLEDPARQYARERFTRVAETHWKWALDSSGGAVPESD